jgi:hypothetical protein
MKYKMLLYSIAVFTGLTMVFAFKPTGNENKKYLTVFVDGRNIVTINEENKIEQALKVDRENYTAYLEQINLAINNAALSGWRLVSSNSSSAVVGSYGITTYIFEK